MAHVVENVTCVVKFASLNPFVSLTRSAKLSPVGNFLFVSLVNFKLLRLQLS